MLQSDLSSTMDTIIAYRWQEDKLRARWKTIAKEVRLKNDLYFDHDMQYSMRQLTIYIDRVSSFLVEDDRLIEAENRAKMHKKTLVEYVSLVFGIRKLFVLRFLEKSGHNATTSFEVNDGGRSDSEIRKSKKRRESDCAVRALTLATGIEYDKVFEGLERIQEEDPTNGTYPYAWKSFLKHRGWRVIEVDFWKSHTTHNLIKQLPKLSEITMLIHTKRHLFYVENGVAKDMGNAMFKNVVSVIVKKDNRDWVEQLFVEKLSIEGLVDNMLKYRLEHPTLTWTQLYEDVGMRWEDGILLRRSECFHRRVNEINKSKWALMGKCKVGDEHVLSKSSHA